MYKPKAFVQIKLPSEFWAGKRVSKLKHRDGLPWRTSAIITWYRRPIYCRVLKIWFIEMVGNKFQDLKANDLSCQVGSCDHLTSASYNPDWTCQRVRIEQKILNHKYLTFFTTRYFLIFVQFSFNKQRFVNYDDGTVSMTLTDMWDVTCMYGRALYGIVYKA